MNIEFSISIPNNEKEIFLEDFFGKTLVEKTEFREAHYHRNTKIVLDDNITLKQKLIIRESLQDFPIEIIIQLSDKLLSNLSEKAIDVAATFILLKLSGKIKKIIFKKKEINVNKDEIIQTLLDEIKRLKDSQ